MALEFICSKTIEPDKKLILPRSANLYILDLSDNIISFCYSNSLNVSSELNTWKVPLNAGEMEFEFRSDRIGGYIVLSRFYDVNGNLLKIGNR